MGLEPLDMVPAEVAGVGEYLSDVADDVAATRGRIRGAEAVAMSPAARTAFEQVRRVLHRGLTGSHVALDQAGTASVRAATAVWATDEASTIGLRRL